MSHKALFSRAFEAAPKRLHFAAHSHHLWPDASYFAHMKAWDLAAAMADTKWDPIFADVIPEAQDSVAKELRLPSGDSVVFAPNTHELLVRLVSAVRRKPVRILSTDGEFHSFRRQAEAWEEAGTAQVTRVPVRPFHDFAERFLKAAREGRFDLILVSQVFFRTGWVFGRMAELAQLSTPAGPWVIIDGYHGFMAVDTDLSAIADRVFYIGGGYKYAMAGEGCAFMHAPEGFGERPEITGWYAEFGDLQGPPGGVGYARDAGRFWGATFDPSALFRFNGVRRMLDDQGLTTAGISAWCEPLIQRFAEAAEAGRAGPLKEAVLLNPVTRGPRARFLAFQHPEAAKWQAILENASVITDVRDDVIRFGFGLYHDPEDVDLLAEVCADLLAA